MNKCTLLVSSYSIMGCLIFGVSYAFLTSKDNHSIPDNNEHSHTRCHALSCKRGRGSKMFVYATPVVPRCLYMPVEIEIHIYA